MGTTVHIDHMVSVALLEFVGLTSSYELGADMFTTCGIHT